MSKSPDVPLTALDGGNVTVGTTLYDIAHGGKLVSAKVTHITDTRVRLDHGDFPGARRDASRYGLDRNKPPYLKRHYKSVYTYTDPERALDDAIGKQHRYIEGIEQNLRASRSYLTTLNETYSKFLTEKETE